MTRILIADDHTVVRRGLMDLMRTEFPQLHLGEAKDAREAANLLSKHKWDLVVLDINMPGRSGLEVLAEIRRDHGPTPVLVLSAYAEEEFAMRAFQLGA